MTTEFTYRLAVETDIPYIRILMRNAITELQSDFLSPAQIEASFAVMGLDSQLIEDGTYYVVEGLGHIVACGGWSYRNTLFGGDHTDGRDLTPLDPAKNAARIRGMYTHPLWVRQGLGRMVLELCEKAAGDAGFKHLKMGATLSGEKLYQAYGYSVEEYFEATAPSGITIPLVKMRKTI